MMDGQETPNPEIAPAAAEQGPDIAKWFKRIKSAESYMTADFKPRYDLARKRLRSELSIVSAKGGRPSHESVNLLYAIGNSYINSVIFKNPDVNFTARIEEERELVENTEIKVNECLKDKKAKRTMRRIAWDAFLGGFGAYYADYEYSDYETGEPLLDGLGAPVLNPEGQPIMKRIVLKNTPVVKRLRPDLVRIPRGFDFDEAQESPFIAFDLLVPVEDVKRDKAFDPAVAAQIKGKPYEALSDQAKRSQKQNNDDVLYARLHYIFIKPEFDGDGHKLLVLSDEVKTQALEYQPFEKGQKGYPIKFLYHNPLDDDISYPCGDAWLSESQFRAVDDYWVRLCRHVKKSNPKWLYDQNVIDPKTLQKLKSNDDLEYVGIKLKDRGISDAVAPVEHPKINQDNDKFLEYSESILNRVAPRSSISLGDAADSKTATEAQLIQGGENIDIDARIDDIRELFIDLAKDLAGLYAQNLQGMTSVRGKDENGIEFSRQVGKEGFSTNFDVDIDVMSLQAPNREVHRKQFMDMMGLLNVFEPALNRIGKTVDPLFFLPRILDTFGVKNAENAIIDLPPMAMVAPPTEGGQPPSPEPIPQVPRPEMANELSAANRT